MSIVRRLLVAVTLLGCAQGAAAREFPVELAKPYYAAIVKECSKKDPANAVHYRAGFKRMLAQHPEVDKAVVDKKVFPNLKQQIAREMATMPEQTLYEECGNLIELAGAGEAARPR